MLNIYFSLFYEPPTAKQWHFLESTLPHPFHQRAKRFHRWQDRCATLLGRMLLLEGLQKIGLSNTDLNTIYYSDFGKPALDGPVYFNISHSGSMVACALTDQGEVGLDVELLRPINLDDFRDWTDPPPWEATANPKEKLNYFYDFWTLRESVLKADGHGMSIHPKEIRVANQHAWVNHKSWCVHPLHIHPDYRAHVATTPPSGTPTLHHVPTPLEYDDSRSIIERKLF